MRATPLVWAVLFSVGACDPSGKHSQEEQDATAQAQTAPATAPSKSAQQKAAPTTPVVSTPPQAAPHAPGAEDPALSRLPAAAQESFRLCSALCAQVAPLRCSSPKECATGCLEMALLPHCSPELHAFLKCSGQKPSTSFECSDGQASLKEGLCVKEQAGFFNCLKTALP